MRWHCHALPLAWRLCNNSNCTMNYALDRSANTYLAVSLSPSSPYLQDPSALSGAHPALTHVGQMGQMRDVQILSVPIQDWNNAQHDVLRSLNAQEGIIRVDVQVLRERTKRGEEEL
jgi:hypothetical protein